MSINSIPYKKLKTIFFDVGNTLTSMDFGWVRKKLKRCGVLCDVEDLRRAEAAARPVVSRELARLRSTEGQETFFFYMQNILRKLVVTSEMGDKEHDEIIRTLLPILRAQGQSLRLWSYLLPGVMDALDMLRKRELRIVAVSNSEGIVEQLLLNLGLIHYFDKVVDSHIVGFEKPDPRLFHHALEISDSDPATTLHIGDIYHIDVLGAWSAGVHALLIDPFGDWEGVDCARLPDVFSFASRFESLAEK
ncbi:HAD family hydrolase [Thermodesulfobacteriota bacterium]